MEMIQFKLFKITNAIYIFSFSINYDFINIFIHFSYHIVSSDPDRLKIIQEHNTIFYVNDHLSEYKNLNARDLTKHNIHTANKLWAYRLMYTLPL